MKYISKNNVNIDVLFNWSKELEVTDMFGKPIMKVYQRVVGDADLNRARVAALKRSAELRRALRRFDSDERLAFVPMLDLVEKENLVEMVLGNQVKSFTNEIIKELSLPLPKEPGSDASLEKQEEYEEAVENWTQRRQEYIVEKLTAKLEVERRKLSILPKERLESLFESLHIDMLCEKEMYTRFNDMCTFYGTYSDAEFENLMFDSVDQFLNLPTEIKSQLVDGYSSLEISIDELKK